jgi:hypothetical protein
VKHFFNPRITWMVYLDPELCVTTASGNRAPDLATAEPGDVEQCGISLQHRQDEPGNFRHTYKTQYWDNVHLLGAGDVVLRLNDYDNCVGVNSGDTTVTGFGGLDVLLLRGRRAEYTVAGSGKTQVSVTDTVEGRDGTTLIEGVDLLAFADVAVEAGGGENIAGDQLAAAEKCRALVGLVCWVGVEEEEEEEEEEDEEAEQMAYGAAPHSCLNLVSLAAAAAAAAAATALLT